MRVAMTGGSGFIGRHLLPRLAAEGWDITLLLREEKPPFELPAGVRTLQGDITDASTLGPLGDSDVLLHMAAVAAVPAAAADPREAFRVNVEGTLNVLETARAAARRPRVVLMSSAHVYGPLQRVPVDEKHPMAPVSVYGATKAAAEALARAYHRELGVPTVVVRPFNVYGPGQSSDYVVATIVEQALAGGPLRLGDTSMVRDFTFVDDFVEFLVRAMREPGAVGEAFNAGTGDGRSVADVVAAVGRALGRELRVEHDPARIRAADLSRVVVDPAKAERVLGWRARTALEEGVRRVVEAAR